MNLQASRKFAPKKQSHPSYNPKNDDFSKNTGISGYTVAGVLRNLNKSNKDSISGILLADIYIGVESGRSFYRYRHHDQR
jgi:hypothetical protein